MKRTFISFPKGKLPKIEGRRFGNTSNASRAYLTDGVDDEEASKLLKKIKKQTEELLATRADKETVSRLSKEFQDLIKGEDGATPFPITALRAMADEKEGVMKKLVDQGIEIAKLKNTMNELPQDMSVRSQILEWQKKNKEAIENVINKRSQFLPEFKLNLEVRAVASPMLPSTTMPNGSAYITKFGVDPKMVDVLRTDFTFWNYLKKGKTALQTYIWINKVQTQGEAAFIAPGVYKPGISFSAVAQSSTAKKIAASEKMATELMEDIDGFEDWVRTELYYAVMIKANNILFSGVESSTVPKGMTQYAVPYNQAYTGVKTKNPNRYDVIAAAETQLRKEYFKGMIVTFVNATDETNMRLTKAISQGQLFNPAPLGSMVVAEQLVPVGSFLTVAIDYYNVKIYKDFTISFGWENDDFTKNLVTVIGEMRLHQYVSDNHIGFAITDTFANVETLITEA